MNAKDAGTDYQLPNTKNDNTEHQRNSISLMQDDEFIENNPPDDNVARNLEALNRRLDTYKASPKEIRQIYLLSNWGQLGHPIWSLFYHIDGCNGKISHPIRFIISRLNSSK